MVQIRFSLDHFGIKKSPIGPLVLGCPRKLGKRLGSVGYNSNISHLQVGCNQPIDPNHLILNSKGIHPSTPFPSIPMNGHRKEIPPKIIHKAQLLRRKYVVTGRVGR